MKKIILLILLSVSLSTFSQEYFEGILKFKSEFRDKTGQMTDEEAKQFLGTEITYYLKGDHYNSSMNGFLQMKTYYNGRDTIYLNMQGNNNLLYTLSSEEEEKIISYEFKETDAVILGYKCELLEVKTNKGFHKYYFNRNIKLNPEDYKNHKAGLWHFFLEKTGGAISLKTSGDLKDSYNAIEVISIEKKQLDESIFKKPNLPIVKMQE
jgi:hypothetical protein